MPIPNIKNDKYTPGPLPEVYAARKGLIALLERESEKRLMLVSAPAGSGKSVSALLWARESGRKTAWIGLDALDNSTSVFYKMFCTGILSVQPDNERMTAILRAPAFAGAPVEHSINLLSEIFMDGNKYMLVMDDFHTITNQKIIKSLPFILRRMPHSFVTLILSRIEPEESFTELAESGQAAVIGSSELAFDEDEIEAYFKSLGHGVESGEARAAFAFTGGWAIGVNALAHSDSPVPDGYGGHALERYIEKQIWTEWDERLRAFMLSSAAVDEMPVTLCAKIAGRADAGELLETLRTENAFVVRVGDGVYRYHHLFLDFLRSQPEYAAANNTKHWHSAAEYYLAEKEYLTARRYAYKSGDTKIMLSTLYDFLENRGFSIDEYLDYSLDFYLSNPMEGLCVKCPVLYISCAWVAFLTGDAHSFEKYVDKILASLPLILVKYPRFGEIAFSILALDYRTPFAKLIARAEFLPPIIFRGDTLRAASMTIQMPFMHRSSRDYHELVETRLYGKLKKTYGKLLKNHYEMIMHGIRAGFLLEQNQLSEALTEAQTAVSMLGAWTVKEMRFAAYIHLAAVYLAMGKSIELDALLEETERFINEEAQFLRPNFLAFTTRIRLWNGDIDAAREWLDRYFVTDNRTLELYRIYQHFTTARAFAALGELEKAKDLAMRLRQLGKNFYRPLDAAEAGALLSAILWACGQKAEAQEIMETVLIEMQPNAFIRVIADEGAVVLPVLKKVLRSCERADYQGGLDRVYANNVYLAAYAISKQRAGVMAKLEAKPVKLSRQQMMILSLLAQGYKRDSIVEKTGLSLSTVKTHLNLTYGKLGVSSAADAVVRAREWGIIE